MDGCRVSYQSVLIGVSSFWPTIYVYRRFFMPVDYVNLQFSSDGASSNDSPERGVTTTTPAKANICIKVHILSNIFSDSDNS